MWDAPKNYQELKYWAVQKNLEMYLHMSLTAFMPKQRKYCLRGMGGKEGIASSGALLESFCQTKMTPKLGQNK